MQGGSGNDTIGGNFGHDYLRGNSGSDLVAGGPGNDDVSGGLGADRVNGDDGVDVLVGDNAGISQGGDKAGRADPATLESLVSGVGIGDGGTPNCGAFGDAADSALADCLRGGVGRDLIYGEGGNDDIDGGNDDDRVHAGDGADNPVHGGSGADVMFGNELKDIMYGDSGDDQMFGNTGDDDMRGGSEHDYMQGNEGADTMRGEGGQDRLIGGTPTPGTSDGSDTIYGGAQADVVLGDNGDINVDGTVDMTSSVAAGSFGDDLVHGDAGQDRIYGQLGGDDLFGDADEDYVVGDLGFITPGSPSGFWPGGAPKYNVALSLAPEVGDVDDIQGGSHDDHLFGVAGGDSMQGGAGDDYMEGNGGVDSMYGCASIDTTGGSDQDDMIGGSSSWTRPNGPRLDGGENLMKGNSDHDVMTGDNADIARIANGGQWAPDEVISGARKRVVTLLDREKVDAALAAVSGDDFMQGNDGSDRMFGEGGADLVQGNAADDLIEGNQAGDYLEGNAGEDDVIGGSSLLASAGGLALPGSDADLGDPDGDDAIFGGDGADVTIGDNAVVIRKTTTNSAAYTAALGSAYFTSDPVDDVPGWWIGASTPRLVRLLDRSTVHSGRFGVDVISGGAGSDVVFGQDGADLVTGGARTTRSRATAAPIRPTVTALRSLHRIQWHWQPAPSSGSRKVSSARSRNATGCRLLQARTTSSAARTWCTATSTTGSTVTARTTSSSATTGPCDVRSRAPVTSTPRATGQHMSASSVKATRLGVNAGNGVSGGDILLGNDGDDAVWGQEGNDDIRGQIGDDDLLGELGDDLIYGGQGEDAMVGDRGSIRNTSLGDAGALFTQAPSQQSYNGPPFFSDPVKYFTTGRYDRRVDLKVERPGAVGGPFPGTANLTIASDGVSTGGLDTMRGGPDHDSMHGGANDDLINGDSGGDFVFGDDGSDVLWGGRGNVDGSADPGTDRSLIDRVFGGRGGNANQGAGIVTGGADIIDYKPRTTGPNIDPASWVAATAPYDGRGCRRVVRHAASPGNRLAVRRLGPRRDGGRSGGTRSERGRPSVGLDGRVQPVHALQRQLRRVQRPTHDLAADARVPAVARLRLRRRRQHCRRGELELVGVQRAGARLQPGHQGQQRQGVSDDSRPLRPTDGVRPDVIGRAALDDVVPVITGCAVVAVSPGGRSRGRIGSEPDRSRRRLRCRSRGRGECAGRASEPRSRCRAVG